MGFLMEQLVLLSSRLTSDQFAWHVVPMVEDCCRVAEQVAVDGRKLSLAAWGQSMLQNSHRIHRQPCRDIWSPHCRSH